MPQTSQASVAVTFPAPQGAGDTNIVAVGWNDTTAAVASVTDSAGNSYQVAAPLLRGGGLSQAIYYAKGVAAGPDTLTVTFSQPAVYADVRALEYSGLDPSAPFDAAAGAAGTAATASSGSAATTAAGDLLVGAGMTVGAFTAAGAGYTARMITSPDADLAEDGLAGAAGSYAATAPASGTWLMQLATFKAAP